MSMRWFFYGLAPWAGLLGSVGLVVLGLLGRSWVTTALGAVALVLMALYVRKLPDLRARDVEPTR